MPTELPQLLVVLLGALSPFVIQLAKKAFVERYARLAVSVILSAGVGVGAYFVVSPEGFDLADSIAWVYAAAQLAYQAFWKPIWASKK